MVLLEFISLCIFKAASIFDCQKLVNDCCAHRANTMTSSFSLLAVTLPSFFYVNKFGVASGALIASPTPTSTPASIPIPVCEFKLCQNTKSVASQLDGNSLTRVSTIYNYERRDDGDEEEDEADDVDQKIPSPDDDGDEEKHTKGSNANPAADAPSKPSKTDESESEKPTETESDKSSETDKPSPSSSSESTSNTKETSTSSDPPTSTTSTPAETSRAPEKSGEMGTEGIIVGSIIGAVAVSAIAFLAVIFFKRWRRHREQKAEERRNPARFAFTAESTADKHGSNVGLLPIFEVSEHHTARSSDSGSRYEPLSTQNHDQRTYPAAAASRRESHRFYASLDPPPYDPHGRTSSPESQVPSQEDGTCSRATSTSLQGRPSFAPSVAESSHEGGRHSPLAGIPLLPVDHQASHGS